MNEKEFEKITQSIQEKLGKEESGKIMDDLANILVFDEANSKIIKEKDETFFPRICLDVRLDGVSTAESQGV